jgi:hypothetical protein
MENNTNLTPNIKTHIATTVTWARYAAILSFVNLGLTFLQLIIGAVKGNLNVFGSVFSFVISGVITLVMGINLLNYSNYAKSSLDNGDSVLLYQALYHLRTYFIVMGILFLIIIGLLLLFVFIAIMVAIYAAAK